MKQSIHPQDLGITVQICSATTQVCRESEALYILVPLPNSPCPHLTFHLWCRGTWLLVLSSSLPSQVPHFHHTAYIPVPLPFPFLLSQPHIYLFLWLLFWVVRTSLVEFFNSHHVGDQTLDTTYGYLGSSASPTSYWPRHPRPLLLSHLESEDSTNSTSIIARTK